MYLVKAVKLDFKLRGTNNFGGSKKRQTTIAPNVLLHKLLVTKKKINIERAENKNQQT